MNIQKFKRGDLVRVAKDLGPHMRHFRNDFDAIVIGSYRDQYGGSDTKSYTLMSCDDGNETSWYEEWQLSFIRHAGESEIEKVILMRENRNVIEGDINWILANWLSIRETGVSGASMGTLMRMIGITDPWGPNGEGYVLFRNQQLTFRLLDAALCTGEKAILEARVKEITQRTS